MECQQAHEGLLSGAVVSIKENRWVQPPSKACYRKLSPDCKGDAGQGQRQACAVSHGSMTAARQHSFVVLYLESFLLQRFLQKLAGGGHGSDEAIQQSAQGRYTHVLKMAKAHPLVAQGK